MKGTLSFLFVGITFMIIGLTIGKHIYTKELPQNMIEVPILKSGSELVEIYNYKDSSFKVIVRVDSAVERGQEFE